MNGSSFCSYHKFFFFFDLFSHLRVVHSHTFELCRTFQEAVSSAPMVAAGDFREFVLGGHIMPNALSFNLHVFNNPILFFNSLIMKRLDSFGIMRVCAQMVSRS